MQPTSDGELLRKYVQEASQEAFAEVVGRHASMVYSVGLRDTGNAAAAQEITQAVFIILAKKAGQLFNATHLGGWVYEVARLTARNYVRNESRRLRREQEAVMHAFEPPAEEAWAHIMPLLEDAMGALRPKDREAIVLRFFEGKSFVEISQAVGITENAVKKRVGHALEKLRYQFLKRGVALSVTALAGAIGAHSVQAAPTALLPAVAAVAAAKGVGVSGALLLLVQATLRSLFLAKVRNWLRLGGGLMAAGSAVTLALLLGGLLPGQAGAVTVPFTATLELEVEWRNREQQTLSSNRMGVLVAVEQDKALIEPWVISARSNTLAFLWATSPFQPGEWIVGAQTRDRGQALTNISISANPVLGSGDPCASLARLLYLPPKHPTYDGIPVKERLYLPVETFGYRPDEVEFQVERAGTAGEISRVTALSPPYYHERPAGAPAPVKRAFQGPPFARTLWTLEVEAYTNWNGGQLPSRWAYTRFQDATSRPRAEDPSVPIALVRGRLLGVEAVASAGIRERLAPALSVIDFRVVSTLGRPITYPSPPGTWPRAGSPEFSRMVATNITALGRPLEGQDQAWRRTPRPWIQMAILVFSGVSLLPLLWVLSRKVPRYPTDKTT